jgi:hypothetical protein
LDLYVVCVAKHYYDCLNDKSLQQPKGIFFYLVSSIRLSTHDMVIRQSKNNLNTFIKVFRLFFSYS